MPRIAATLGTFLLIAASIGFNIWRYPVVWEMAGRSPGEESFRSEDAAQSAAPGESSSVPRSEDAEHASSIWQSAPITLPDSDPATHRERQPVPPSDAAPSPAPHADNRDAFGQYQPYQPSTAEYESTVSGPASAADQSFQPSARPVAQPIAEYGTEAAVDPTPPPAEAPWANAAAVSQPAQYGNPRGPAEIAPTPRYATDVETTELAAAPIAIVEKPLVPVTGYRLPLEQDATLISDERIRRLPPVENDSRVAEYDARQLPDEPIPIYPTTNVE